MEYLKQVWKVLKQCTWAKPGKSLKNALLMLVVIISACAFYALADIAARTILSQI